MQQTWLTRYPRPTKLVYDKETEFMKDFVIMTEDDYEIKRTGITKRNPQANAMIKKIHQTVGSMIRTFEINKTEIDEKDPWSGIRAADVCYKSNLSHNFKSNTFAVNIRKGCNFKYKI